MLSDSANGGAEGKGAAGTEASRVGGGTETRIP